MAATRLGGLGPASPWASKAERAGLSRGSGMGAMELLHPNGRAQNQPDRGDE